MSPQYGELRPISGGDRLASLGHPIKFQQVSCLGFDSGATLFIDGQPNFAWCLAVSWAATLYIHFRCPLMEFHHVQNSLCVRVLHSPILAALLHGTAAASISQTSRRGTRNGITELPQRVPPIFGWAPSRWASTHILVCVWNISGPLNGFVPNSHGRRDWSLARMSLKVKVKGQGNQGQKRYFSALSAA